MFLYHGSNIVVNKPQLVSQNRALDFGTGFYTTENKSQAFSFAGRVFRRRKDGKPVVSIYELDEIAAFAACDFLRFDYADETWLDFVSAHRNRTYKGEFYEIICGPVANDDVYVTFQLYAAGELSKEETIGRLRIKKLYNQMVFSSERALSYLKFIETLDGGNYE